MTTDTGDPRQMHVTDEPPPGSVVAIDWNGAHPEVWVANSSNIGCWYSPDIPMRGDWHPHWEDVVSRARDRRFPLVLLVAADSDTYKVGYATGIRAAAAAIEELG
jgi:hypothetical protein